MQQSHDTAKQVSELAECSKIWVQKNLELGKLKSFREGKYGRGRGRHIIPAEEVARFVSEIRLRRMMRESKKFNP
ncbi:MAG TPA: hypothetical protein VFO40_24275 [Chthoniobacterales bacterium]|nr:hypothetical protein [Chthoniobacterales bacterium]